jgi:hypothetical protein
MLFNAKDAKMANNANFLIFSCSDLFCGWAANHPRMGYAESGHVVPQHLNIV